MLSWNTWIANQAAAIHVGFILIYQAVTTRRIGRRLGAGIWLRPGVYDNGASTRRKSKGARY